MKDKFHLVGTQINEYALPCYADNSSDEPINIRSYKGMSNVVVILLRDIR
ncbi:MAG: hypothetical protein ACTSRE_09975 [Promethearchaeota archaeon]